MKRYNIVVLLSLCYCFWGCSSDDKTYLGQHTLEQTMADAEHLIETTAEGLEEDDYPPGSQSRLLLQIDWCKYIIETANNDKALQNANKILQEEIEVYKTNLVKGGYPFYDQGAYFNLGKVAEYNINKQFTIECKVRFKDFGTSLGNIISAEGGAGAIILRNNGDIIEAYIDDGDWLGGSSNVKQELNKWYHLAFTYSGSEVILYIDGDVVMRASGEKKEVLSNNTVNLHIGTHPSYSERYMTGNVAYVSIWNYPRTKDQIQSDLEPSFEGVEDGLLAYWPFDANLGSSILDKTGKWSALGTSVTWNEKE